MQKKTTQKSIIFPTEIVELIQKIGKIEDRDFSKMLIRIIKDYFNNTSIDRINNTNKSYSKEILDLINEWQKT